MEQVAKFLKEADTYYLATVEGCLLYTSDAADDS